MFGRKKAKAWKTPGGPVYNLYADMAKQPHLLVAGATGSGKSVVINGVIATILHDAPCEKQLVLVDPKRVELVRYRDLPHCVCYASEPDSMVMVLQQAIDTTEQRYQAMQKKRVLKYDGADLYVIIDELADLMTTNKKEVMPLLQRLCQIGRAARVHVIAATQCPIVQVIPTPIKVNFDARVALRTSCAQDSRNILSQTGCELLPRYGQGYYRTPDGLYLYNIPMISEFEIAQLIRYWSGRDCVA